MPLFLVGQQGSVFFGVCKQKTQPALATAASHFCLKASREDSGSVLNFLLWFRSRYVPVSDVHSSRIRSLQGMTAVEPLELLLIVGVFSSVSGHAVLASL